MVCDQRHTRGCVAQFSELVLELDVEREPEPELERQFEHELETLLEQVPVHYGSRF